MAPVRGIGGAHEGHETAEVRDVWRTGGGRGLRGGRQKKEWTGSLLDDLRVFVINANQWMTAAQDDGKWRKTAEQGVERFITKWIAAEKVRAGLRQAVVCPNMTGKTKEDSPKQACSCWFASHS